MAKRDLGYVELIWVCPTCDSRNPGTVATCRGCGAPQPADVKFELPESVETLNAAEREDAAKIARAQAGPDIHCGYCGARNPATGEQCIRCGADLAAGTARAAGGVVGAPGETAAASLTCRACGTANPGSYRYCSGCGAPLTHPAPAADAAPASRAPANAGAAGGVALLVAAALLIAVAAAFFLFRGMRTTETVGTVVDTRWMRQVMIAAPVPVQHEAWRDQIPYGAAVGACTREIRRYSSEPQPGAEEVCGTPYVVDTGTGVGRMQQDCDYAIYDQRCRYTALEWRVVNTVVADGAGFGLAWPEVRLQGEERIDNRREEFQCILLADDRRYTYSPRSEAEYQLCRAGSEFTLEVNGFGDVVSATPR